MSCLARCPCGGGGAGSWGGGGGTPTHRTQHAPYSNPELQFEMRKAECRGISSGTGVFVKSVLFSFLVVEERLGVVTAIRPGLEIRNE